jgi:hypothetical protein
VPVAVFLVNNGWWDADEMPDQKAAITNKIGFDGTDEYDPLGDDHLDLPAKVPQVKVVADDAEGGDENAVEVNILNWDTEHKKIVIDAREESRVAMRILNYPAWRVEVNGKIVAPERMDDVNQMVIPVEPGKSVIEIRFARTADRVIGNIVSLISLGLVIGLFFLRRRS